MITELDDIPLDKLLDTIIALQKAINVTVTRDQISFTEKNHETSYYRINGKSQGRVTVNNHCKSATSETGYETEVQLSADDIHGNFLLFPKINKIVHWYMDDKLDLKSQFTVVQDKRNESKPYAYCIQIVGYLDKYNNLEKITYMYYGYTQESHKVIEKTGQKLLSIEEENLLARYSYHQFKHPESFSEMFDDVEGPMLKPLTSDEIEKRLTILEALKY